MGKESQPPGIYIMEELFGEEKVWAKEKGGGGCGCLVLLLILVILTLML